MAVLRTSALAVLVGLAVMADPAAADEAYIVAGGSIRVLGVAFDNVRDFKDSNGWFRDSESFYQTRFRLYTVAESRDLKARAVWALEVGDITWGAGGGASGGEFGCSGETPRVNSRITTVTPTSPVAIKVQSADPNTRVGPGAGGCLGERWNQRRDEEPLHPLRVALVALGFTRQDQDWRRAVQIPPGRTTAYVLGRDIQPVRVPR